MQSGSSDLFKMSSVSPARRSGLRLIEWLIAVMFIVTLLIASGVFFKVSNAADNRVQANSAGLAKSTSIAPGTIGTMQNNTDNPDIVVAKNELPTLKRYTPGSMDDTSCELKP
jgi:Na+(H+)/acetate symporter ActP